MVLLAEGGLLVLIPFLILLLFNIYHFVVNYRKRTELENAFYWSFLAMTIHIYLISEILNVFAWFLIAMTSAISLKYSSRKTLK
jgi:O-antigen ligase